MMIDIPPMEGMPPGMNITIGVRCQLQVQAGFVMPSDFRAIDGVTGETLLFIKRGDAAVVDTCVNAPDGHELHVNDGER